MKETLKLALEALKHNQHLIADNERHAYVMEYNSIIEKCEEALAQPEQEPTGCACRWDDEGDRTVTCARHEGWLEVIAEWADRAREAEKKLKALEQPEPLALAQASQEPVLWMMPDGKTADKWALQFYGGQKGKPLYTTPPAAQRRILELEALLEGQTALLERQTARIVDLQTHIENFDGEDR